MTIVANIPYTRVHPTFTWKAPGRGDLAGDQPSTTTYGPVSFSSLAEARAVLGAPTDANYVPWTFGNAMLEEVFMGLGANDILVLPERETPYYVDSADGFRAGGVAQVDGPNGTRVNVVSTYRGQSARTWFSMSRARRGILGLGPNVVIAPSASSFTQGAQPYPQTCYFNSGATQQLVGSQNSVIELEHARPFVANFKMLGRDFGGVSYTAIKTVAGNGSSNLTTWKNLDMFEAWRGFSGVPNGETAGIEMLYGKYLIENVKLTPNGKGPSPIMWNRTTGGTIRNVSVGRPNHGMMTFWRCDGTNTFENVSMDGNGQVLNLEEGGPGFILNWTDGEIATTGQYHIIGESSNGSKKIHFDGVTVIGGQVAGALNTHWYSYTDTRVQRASDITRTDGPVVSVGQVIS